MLLYTVLQPGATYYMRLLFYCYVLQLHDYCYINYYHYYHYYHHYHLHSETAKRKSAQRARTTHLEYIDVGDDVEG